MMFDVLYLMYDSMIHDSQKIKQKLNLKPPYLRTYGGGELTLIFWNLNFYSGGKKIKEKIKQKLSPD